MSDEVRFDPDVMDEVAADIDVQADRVADAGTTVGGALGRFLDSSSEFVPAIADHGNLIGTHAALLSGLATSVMQLADAARQADEMGIDLREIVDAPGISEIGTADAVNSPREALVGLVRLAGHGSMFVRTGLQQLRIDQRYGTRAMPDIAAIRREIDGGARMERRAVRAIQMRRYRELKQTRRALDAARSTAATNLRTNSPLTRFGTRVDDFMRTTRTGSVLRTGGRALGVAGVALGGLETYQDFREGDTEGMIVNGIGTVGNAMMFSGNPVIMGAGAVLTVGVVVYENWDTISDTASDAWEGAKSLGGGLVDGATDLFGGVF